MADRIILTGASSGIGAALAQEYAAPGASLLLIARNAERLAEVANAARAKGAEVARHTRVTGITRRPSGEWQVTTEVFAAPDEVTIQYGASDDWQGPAEAEVDVFARDYPSLEAAYLQLRTDALAAAAAGDPARPYVLGLEPGAIYRERLSMRNRSFPESHPVRIVTIGGGDRATITGADILSGFVPCTNADADRVGSDFANIYKVNVPAPDFHGNALNLHEDGEILTHVTDRAQEPENTLFKFNPLDWYTAAEQTAFPDDEGDAGEGPIESYTDPFFLNRSVRVTVVFRFAKQNHKQND